MERGIRGSAHFLESALHLHNKRLLTVFQKMNIGKVSKNLFYAIQKHRLHLSVPLQWQSSVTTSSSQPPQFPVVESTFDSWSNSDEAKKNKDKNLKLFSEVTATRDAIYESDNKVRTRDRSSRKLTVRERIDLLKDEGSEVFDIGLWAGFNMPYGRVNNASNAVSIIKISGETCIVSANDWTFKGGTVYPITVKKQLRAQEISMENRLPCIYLVDSGGAFLPLQV